MTSAPSTVTASAPRCTNEASLRYCRIVTLILAFTILIVGLISHYRSSWVSLHFTSDTEALNYTQLHKLCEVKYFYGNCPDIILEQFYVSVISINFIFSALGVLTYYLWYRGVTKGHPLKWLDLTYHAVSAGALLVAAVVYLVSALQIQEFAGGVIIPKMNFKTEEKIIAAALTIIQAGIHGIIVVLVGRCASLKMQEDSDRDFCLTTFSNNNGIYPYRIQILT